MGNDFEDFISDEVLPRIEEKYKYNDISLADAGYTKMKKWAYSRYEDVALDHAYEAPWREGWVKIKNKIGEYQLFDWHVKDDDSVIVIKKIMR